MIQAKAFIAAAEQIAAEEPAYKSGHDGHDGLCDCIGLVIGAIRRCGGQWRGLHGSNYAARYELTDKVAPISGSGDLAPGEVVFKGYDVNQGGYNLPDRYLPGRQDYTGDLHDYYHVGIVISVSPLRIRHMTTPKPKMDTKLGKWGFHGKLKKIDYSGGGGAIVEEVNISGGNLDKPVNMRQSPSSQAKLAAQIPQGSRADLLEDLGAWCRIRWNNLTGYIMTSYVHRKAASDSITVSKADLEKAYDILGDLLGLRG